MKKFRQLKEEVSTPPIGVRSLYTKMYAKHGGIASKTKEAQSKAYAEVEKKHGKDMRNSLEAYHKKNMNEEMDNKKHPFVAVHAKKGTHETHASTSYEAAQNAAKHWKMKNTGGIDVYRSDKTHVGEEYSHMNEAVKDKFDIGEYDQEGDMAKSDLRSILANAKRVHDMLEDDDNLPEWVQSKITKAEDYMSTVANYMEAEMNEEVELDEAMSNDDKSSIALKALVAKKNLKQADNKVKSVDFLKKMKARVKAGEDLKKEEVELDEENKPTNPELWARAKSMAKSKFDVYPSAYANGWAAKWYKSKGGGWRSVNEENYEVTVMHTTKDGDKGEHTHKITNADDARHAKNIALQKHEKMLKSKGQEVRGMGTTTAKIVEQKEEPKDYPGEKGNMWHPTGKTGTHMASGKKTFEYAEVDKEGKKTGARHYKDIQGKHMGEAKEDNLPFTPDAPKKKSVVVGKKPEGYSIARQLARQAMQKQMQKMKKPMKEETNKAKIVKDVMKKKQNDEKFQSEPVLSNTITRNN